MATTVLTWGLIAVLISSFAMCGLLVLTQRWHGRLSLDNDLHGVQKLHMKPVPRIGGLGLLVGLCIATAASYASNGQSYLVAPMLLACAAPVFMSGLLEDLTKKIGIRTRLLTSFISAALASWMLDATLAHVDTPLLDIALSYPPIALLFTVFAVGGVTHSINIIDGLNGLAAGAVSVMLAGLAALAGFQGDWLVMKLCMWGIAAMVGFLMLNYPFGRIFLGDGGAYLAGFWLAECAVLLLVRQPNVSAWTVLLVCFYPVWETIFSMYRRHVRNRVQSGKADMAHLHQLIYQSLNTNTQLSSMPAWSKHGLTSAVIWCAVLICQIVAVNAENNTAILVGVLMAYAAIYCWLYQLLLPRHKALRDTPAADPARV